VEGSRFLIRQEGGTAELTYSLIGKQILLKHTEVPQALRGGGIAGTLAHAALEYARSHDLTVIPVCPYVIAYLAKHPEYQSLVKGQFVPGAAPKKESS
jgi:predicted GNAT family acetyltransferase